MSEGGVATTAGIEEVLAELRSRERFLLTAHEGPDGDALGSLLGMHHLLGQLGKDSVMFMAAKEFPLPIEYRFLPLEEVFHEPPADMADRTVIFLDCGNIDRMPVEFLSEGDNFRINIDHHHDNTLFGDVNLVEVGASSTAEIVYELAIALGAEITPEIAAALYVGLITDTGKFMYENTNAQTHRIAADLIDAGVAVDETYRRLYEHVPIEKLKPALARPRRHPALLRRAAGRLLHHRCRLRGKRGRRGDDRGDHRPPALDRGHEGGGADPRPGRPRPRRAQGQPALQRRRDRRLGDGAQTRGRGPQARRRLLDRSRARRAGQLPLWRSRKPSSGPERGGDRGRLGAALRQAGGQDLARHRPCRTAGTPRRESRPRRHPRPLRHRPAPGPDRTGNPPAALPGRAAEDLRRPGPLRLALKHRRPRRRADARPGACRARWSCPRERCASGCR